MRKILHQVWIQGESNLPAEYKENREKWKSRLGPEWDLILWDEQRAQARWADYKEFSAECSHHAMRADLILARALRDIGGMACGTDVIPNNIENLLCWLETNDSLVIVNVSGKSASNGLAYFADIGHPFIACVCRHQLRDRRLLRHPNVWRVTGPGCWYEALAAHPWNLSLATDARAYTRFFSTGDRNNPLAWVDPGYAGSWHPKAQ
ncbi:MAG: hypothetical protein KA004_12010 [Verrucomicrobiales bacterium]|nr:hypothetical protein [Verrucomicrobiales bacterium]